MYHQPYFWKRIPFARLIVPFIAGILIEWNLSFSVFALLTLTGFSSLIIISFSLLPFAVKYTFRWIPGIVINLLLIITGAFILSDQNICNRPNWIGNLSSANMPAYLATINEPLVEKAKTYKAEAIVEAINTGGQWKSATGKVLVYFSKDTSISQIKYGSQILFHKPLQPIESSGNPGAFDYSRYNAFLGVYHQVFLKRNDYLIAKSKNENVFKSWLIDTRVAVIKKLQLYIKGDEEAAVAEALLIGYRNDLDKDIVQAYSNTGVVHIIAISGLHLGMIYGFLIVLFAPIKKYRFTKWLKPVVILVVLWVFTLLAGAVPSILRSAVMFSFIVLGDAMNKKSSIYNTLAASAFVILCFNPYYLWDVGFQLSYAAVISIVTFSKPVYNWFYIKNKTIDFFWKLSSVTIAAQVLTLPIIFYSFHQFPNLFLLTNCVVVPLSSVILFAGLALLITTSVPFVASLIGSVTSGMLAFMNGFIREVNDFPFAVYDGIQNNLAETIFLYVFIISISYWLLRKRKSMLFLGLGALLCFTIIDSYENFTLQRQKKILIYNVPKHSAIDFVSGRKFAFVGDTALAEDGFLTDYHLEPSRTFYRTQLSNRVEGLYISYPFIQYREKRIALINKPFKFESPARIPVDLIIVSHNPRVYISELAKVFDCKQYIFDASNSTWKINQWKKDCDSLHLPNYSTPDKGAFELDL